MKNYIIIYRVICVQLICMSFVIGIKKDNRFRRTETIYTVLNFKRLNQDSIPTWPRRKWSKKMNVNRKIAYEKCP